MYLSGTIFSIFWYCQIHAMKITCIILSSLLLFGSCKTSGPSIFGKRSLHEQYGEKLESAGLKNTALGAAWFKAAEAGLSSPVNINIPYKELGYFPADQPKAVSVRFSAKRGERLTISLDKKPLSSFTIYVELWRDAAASTSRKLLETLDTLKSSFTYDVENDETYILRLQPELLSSGEYTFSIQNGPSLAFPVQTNKPTISSFWGADRDAGARRHEGVDIFAARGTPLLAAASGRITRVEETNIGGKVVWLTPENKNYTLYYAHLDEQLVTTGQQVKAGDVVGKVGNTGNAKTTGPHLHFGIYTSSGAVDPLLFIQPVKNKVPDITANIENINKHIRSGVSAKILASPDNKSTTIKTIEKNTPLKVEAAVASWYKIQMSDRTIGFIPSSATQQLNRLQKNSLANTLAMFDAPHANAARKMIIEKGSSVNVLGSYENFSYVEFNGTMGWMQL